MKPEFAKILIVLGAGVAVSGYLSSPLALLLGVVIAVLAGNPYADKTKALTGWLIALAIVGLGASIPLKDIAQTGAHGVLYTIIGIALTFMVGLALGRFLKIAPEISCLITAGTAICGGSAIAAVSKVIGARNDSIAVSLAIVFLLNAAALFIFPFTGHLLALSQSEFGLWAGLAIHDTSSVVGAGLVYGDEAAKIATMIKLTRALWIIPLSFAIGLSWKKDGRKIPVLSILKRCWFIGGFVAMAVLSTYSTELRSFSPFIELISKRMMVLALYFIGAGMTRELLKQVGYKPFLQGVSLWVVVSLATLSAILAGLISL